MKRSVSVRDIVNFARLDMLYNQVRLIEAKQNQTQYKCLGSGECCHIGLVIPMFECANIAFRLTQQYYLIVEDKGQEQADEWMQGVIASLKEAMYDETWSKVVNQRSFALSTKAVAAFMVLGRWFVDPLEQ